MSTTKLTEQQLNFLHTFGYLQFPGLLRDCIDRIIEEFETVFARNGNAGFDGKPHDGTKRTAIVPFIDQSEYLSGLLDDPRIDDVISSIVGEDYTYLGSDGNYYVGNTFWHSDGGWPRPMVGYKLALYLDPLTHETGALRFIPGSHHFGDVYSEELQKGVAGNNTDPGIINPYWGVPDDQIPAVAMETQPGDVVIFRQGLKHSSWKGGTRRRMFAFSVYPRFTEEQLPTLRWEIGRMGRAFIESAYGEAMVRTAGPKRMMHLEQVLANQDHLPELARQARERAQEQARA